jgi:hypothetical protein
MARTKQKGRRGVKKTKDESEAGAAGPSNAPDAQSLIGTSLHTFVLGPRIVCNGTDSRREGAYLTWTIKFRASYQIPE